jgi:hypothetical protein
MVYTHRYYDSSDIAGAPLSGLDDKEKDTFMWY